MSYRHSNCSNMWKIFENFMQIEWNLHCFEFLLAKMKFQQLKRNFQNTNTQPESECNRMCKNYRFFLQIFKDRPRDGKMFKRCYEEILLLVRFDFFLLQSKYLQSRMCLYHCGNQCCLNMDQKKLKVSLFNFYVSKYVIKIWLTKIKIFRSADLVRIVIK